MNIAAVVAVAEVVVATAAPIVRDFGRRRYVASISKICIVIVVVGIAGICC